MTQTTVAGPERPQQHLPGPAGPEPQEGSGRCPPGEQTRVRAQSPAALLAVIPYLLGFTPRDSLVVLGISAPRGDVRVTMRYDLPAGNSDLIRDYAAHAAGVLTAERLSTAILVGYGPDAEVRPLADAITEAAGARGIEVRECLRSHDGRYWSYSCRDEQCCPADGIPFNPADHPAAALLASTGRVPLADRGALADGIAPIGGIAAESMREATRRAERHVTQVLAKVRKSHRIGAARHMIACEGLAAVSALIRAYREGGKYKTDYEVAWLTVALRDMRVRDDAWARMDPQFCAAHRRLWTDVVRRAQPGYVAAPASLLAFVAWQGGNGALANVALDRALADDRDYSMASLLRDVIAAGTPPALARPPLTPEDVAGEYEMQARDLAGYQAENGDEDELAACDAEVPPMTWQTALR